MKIGKVCVGHPVDVASGTQFTAAHDVEIWGIIPLIFRRAYSTAHLVSNRSSILGLGWIHSFEMTLKRDLDGFRFFGHDGDEVAFNDPLDQINHGGSIFSLGDGMELRREGQRYAVIHWHNWNTDVHKFMFRDDGAETMQLDSIELVSGHALILRYDDLRRIVEIRQSTEPRTVSLEYNVKGLLSRLYMSSSVIHREVVATYDYDDRDMLVAVHDVSGHAARYAYDDENRLVMEHGHNNGAVYRMKYDDQGRCIETSGNERYGLRRFEFDEAKRTTKVTDSLGNVTIYECNSDGQVVEEVKPNGAIFTTEFDEYGRIVSKIGPLGDNTKFVYSERGDMVLTTYPNYATLRLEYNEDHQPTLITQNAMANWRLRYQRGALTSVVDPLGAEIHYLRDNDNNIREIHTPAGNIISYWHNEAWTEDSYSDEYGLVLARHYDTRLGVTANFDARGLLQRYEYDPLGRLVTIIESDGARTEIVYNEDGLIVKSTNPLGAEDRFEWTPYGELAKTINANGNVYEYARDSEGRLVQIINPKREVAMFSYDGVGNDLEKRFFDGAVEQAEFDLLGRRTKLRKSDDTVVEFQYDLVGNLLKVVVDGTELINNKYDIFGELIESKTPHALNLFEYDLCGRLRSETQNGLRVEYTYDAHGNLSRRRFEGAKIGTLDFEYDKRNRLVSLGTRGYAFQRFSYDGADLLVKRTMGRCTEQFEHDLRRRVKAQEFMREQKTLVRNYSYDAAGNLTNIMDSFRGQISYEYDPAEQLIATTHSMRGTTRYRYDPCGNIIKKGEEQALLYERGDRLVSNGSVRYERDARGNLIASGAAGGASTRFHWDALDRLVKVVHPDGNETNYGYDGLWRRVFKVHAGQKTEFYWMGDDLLCERTGEKVIDYAIGFFTPHILWEDGQLRHVLCGYLPLPHELVDQQGNFVWWGEYDPWGKLLREEVRGGSNRLRLPGQFADQETGLHYNYHRYFDPASCQYISPDPLGFEGGPNRFRYAPNPINYADPLGLKCKEKGFKKHTVYVLTKGKPPRIVYVGITEQCPSARLRQHADKRDPGDFDNMQVIATGLSTRRQARNIEGSALRNIYDNKVPGVPRDSMLNDRRKESNPTPGFIHSYNEGTKGTGTRGRPLSSAEESSAALNNKVGDPLPRP
jgi:RHS repeat-associated protein